MKARDETASLNHSLQGMKQKVEALEDELQSKTSELAYYKSLSQTQKQNANEGSNQGGANQYQHSLDPMIAKMEMAKDESRAKLEELVKHSKGAGTKAFGVKQNKPLFGVRRNPKDGD